MYSRWYYLLGISAPLQVPRVISSEAPVLKFLLFTLCPGGGAVARASMPHLAVGIRARCIILSSQPQPKAGLLFPPCQFTSCFPQLSSQNPCPWGDTGVQMKPQHPTSAGWMTALQVAALHLVLGPLPLIAGFNFLSSEAVNSVRAPFTVVLGWSLGWSWSCLPRSIFRSHRFGAIP